MPFIDTRKLNVWERRPGWRGRHYRSETMSFASWDFSAGGAIHEHHHPNEEVWYVIEVEPPRLASTSCSNRPLPPSTIS